MEETIMRMMTGKMGWNLSFRSWVVLLTAILIVGLFTGCGESSPKYSLVVKNASPDQIDRVMLTMGQFAQEIGSMEPGKATDTVKVYETLPETAGVTWSTRNGQMHSETVKLASALPRKFEGLVEISIDLNDKVSVAGKRPKM
jgi:hypothetical protein